MPDTLCIDVILFYLPFFLDLVLFYYEYGTFPFHGDCLAWGVYSRLEKKKKIQEQLNAFRKLPFSPSKQSAPLGIVSACNIMFVFKYICSTNICHL